MVVERGTLRYMRQQSREFDAFIFCKRYHRILLDEVFVGASVGKGVHQLADVNAVPRITGAGAHRLCSVIPRLAMVIYACLCAGATNLDVAVLDLDELGIEAGHGCLVLLISQLLC